MSSKLQHILLNLEVAPPQENWQSITARLEEEYDSSESIIADKLSDWESTPPSAAWNNILTGLQEPPEKNATVIFSFRKLAVAAAVIGLIILAAWYYLIGPVSNTKIVKATTIPATADQPTASADVPPAVPVFDVPAERPVSKRISRPASQNLYAAAVIPGDNYYLYASTDNIRRSGTHSTTTAKSPNVVAPQIRDAQGRVIMDESLITSADKNYVIVTAPNGEQTRISTRFIQMLGVMNADLKPSDYFDYFYLGENSIGWKIKFSEWRNKILQQASYIPTATNFFDILEMKDLLEENQ